MNSAEFVNAISIPPNRAIGKNFLISNWWMGSMTGSVSFVATDAARAFRRGRSSSSLRTGRVQCLARSHTCRPHHVENTSGEAEQQKHDHPPRRDSQPTIDQPADRRTDQDPGDELGREPKTAGDRRWIGGRTLTRAAFGRTVGMNVAEPFAETLEPRGERSLVGRWLFAIHLSFACVVGHAFDTRDRSGRSRQFRRPKAARTILTGSGRVKNWRA